MNDGKKCEAAEEGRYAELSVKWAGRDRNTSRGAWSLSMEVHVSI
jgi:hypothetical protein